VLPATSLAANQAGRACQMLRCVDLPPANPRAGISEQSLALRRFFGLLLSFFSLCALPSHVHSITFMQGGLCSMTGTRPGAPSPCFTTKARSLVCATERKSPLSCHTRPSLSITRPITAFDSTWVSSKALYQRPQALDHNLDLFPSTWTGSTDRARIQLETSSLNLSSCGGGSSCTR
jgi:hypothetical protein